MANTFQTTSLIHKAVAFQWKAFEGFADRVTFRNDLLPSAVDNTGYSVQVRRPSRHKATAGAVNTDYSLPGVTQPTVGYSDMTDNVLPFTVSQRFETNLQVSMEELMFKLDKKDAMDRHITPAIVDLRNQINSYVAGYIELFAGATMPSDGTSDGVISSIFKARANMISRAGINQQSDKTLLLNPTILPTLGLGSAKIFHANAANTYAQGDFEPIAGFNLFESPVLSTPSITALGASLTASIVAAGTATTAANAATQWTQTTSVNVSGFTASSTVKAGTKIRFRKGAGTGNYINWAVPSVATATDAGYIASFTLVADAVIASDGTGVLVFSEPFVPGGDAKNVMSALVAGTTIVELAAVPEGTVLTSLPSILRPSYAFGKEAIIIGSPEVAIPKGVSYGANLKLGGFNIALIEDHWPGTLQNITKLVAFIAVAVPKPEAITVLY